MENEEQRLRFPLGTEEDATAYDKPYSEALKNELIRDIEILPAMLELAIHNLDEDQLQTPYRPGGWTVHQLIHHIADSHLNAYTRFKLGLTEETPVIIPYVQEAWATLPDTNKLPVNISLTLLHALHARWYQLMNDMTSDQWQRTVYHPERKKKLTLWALLKSYSWHGLHHTAHITKLRERMKWS
jgi:uncharacterized damage-inducible protein DinB